MSTLMIDAHCHSVTADDLSDADFAQLCTESSAEPAAGTSYLDSPFVLSIRRWCAPALGLSPLTTMDVYLRRRRQVGGLEATRLLLRDCGFDALLVDTGHIVGQLQLAELADVAHTPAFEILRLETLAEELAPTVPAHQFPAALRAALGERVHSVSGFKSVLAYRDGFDIDPDRPGDAAVVEAISEWRASWSDDVPTRLTHPVLLRFLLWEGLTVPAPAGQQRRPVQLHAGYGDADLDLHRANPSLLTSFIRAAQRADAAPMVFLHCYPYHRDAAYLASVYPNVYFDIGLAVAHVGPSAERIIAEALELAPFGKMHFSTDGSGLAEAFHVGVKAFVNGLDRVLRGWVDDGAATDGDYESIRAAILGGNATRLYPRPVTLGPGQETSRS